MQLEAPATRLTVRCVIAAAADVTGTPVAEIMARPRHQPSRTPYVCAKAAAAILVRNRNRAARGFGLGSNAISTSFVERTLRDHPEVMRRIMRRAAEISRNPQGARTPHPRVKTCTRSVLIAASQVTGASIKDIVSHGRMQPWENYYLAAQAAARRLGIGTREIARVLGRAPNTLANHKNRFARIEERHGPLIDRIEARAREVASLPTAEIEALYRGPTISAVPVP